jgi:hypothetical protein
MVRVLAFLAVLGLAGCDAKGEAPVADATQAVAPSTPAAMASAAPPRPELSRCAPFKPDSGDSERQRDKPLVFPAALNDIVATDRDHIAILTLDGGTLCIDARWQDSIEEARLSKDGRFLSWDWGGYEAYGHELIDRSGKGQEIDTGASPVASPSGRRLGAVEWSESGFGALNGVLVLQVMPQGLKELARIEQLPEEMADWRLDRWRGEGCFEVSAVRWSDYPDNGEISPATPRQHFQVVERGGGWTVIPGGQGCPG